MSDPPRVDRRCFLARTAQLGLTGASLLAFGRELHSQSIPPPAAPKNVVVGGAKDLLGPSDFKYVGSFRMPFWAAESDAGWGRGLAHRYVNKQLRFLSTTASGRVYEVVDPGLTVAPPYPLASQMVAWGPVGRTKSYTAQDGLGSGTMFGLFWDPLDSRLYWSYAHIYNAVDGNDPSVGCSRLDDTTGRFTDIGTWRFTGRGCKATGGGVTPIPPWFADRYCPGKRLGAGFGTGFLSIYSTGPVHMGPALCTFAPPDLAETPDRSTVAYTNLVGYPYSAKPYGTPDRCRRDTDYVNEYDGWNPKEGVGFWNWGDWIWQGGVWVDTSRKTGLLFFPTMSNGRTFYQNSTQNAERASHAWYVYDPADLALVASRAREQWQVQPSRFWSVQYPGLQYPLRGWADEPMNLVVGSTFDATAGRLYIAVRFSWGSAPEAGHLVHAYDVL